MQKVFILNYGDGGMLGIYSSVKKAIDAAEASFTSRNLTMSGSQAAMARKTLRENHRTARLLALEAVDPYDEAKTLVIEGWSVL